MKNILVLALIILAFFSGCEKNVVKPAAPETIVVNLNVDTFDVYIGRGRHISSNMLTEGIKPDQEGWLGNPHPIGYCKLCDQTHTREECIEAFRTDFYKKLDEDHDFRTAVLALNGKRLGCYCKPKACHGDVIKEWIDSQPQLRPEWAKDLIIYEVAIKGFTSPDGPESGTFISLMEKMQYLEDLGVNAIWLTGHSLSDPKHFYGIWTQYACIEPGKLDPSLGTEQEFKEMIAEAHRRGIRIILDTIELGLMSYSPLIEEHPDWFKGGSWGMTDYDWDGDHPELEKWWIDMWTKAVLDWGVDGFRCDCGLHRPDLWQEIKRQCAQAGKPIVILGESGVESVSDASQRDIMLFDQRKGIVAEHIALNDLGSMKDLLHQELKNEDISFNCEITYDDGTSINNTKSSDSPKLTFLGVGKDEIGYWEVEKDGQADWTWRIENIDKSKNILNIHITSPERNWSWQSNGWGWKLAVQMDDDIIVSGGNPLPGPRLRIISPSCHDMGWAGYPQDKSPYVILGSRYLFGYTTLFAPAIPVFMSGEEFDAIYRPLPGLTPDLYGEGQAGTGTWLYGTWLDWDQLNDQKHSDMLKDVKRMLAIRRDHQDLIHAIDPDDVDIKMNSVEIVSKDKLPLPYMLTNGKRALLIVGNPMEHEVEVELNISLKALDFPLNKKHLKVSTLWPEEMSIGRLTTEELSRFRITIPADKIPGGGLAVYLFELK